LNGLVFGVSFSDSPYLIGPGLMAIHSAMRLCNGAVPVSGEAGKDNFIARDSIGSKGLRGW
jgi:hypothetical protein